MPRGQYQDDNGVWNECEIIRMCRGNSRIELSSGDRILWPSARVRLLDLPAGDQLGINPHTRIVPEIPLQRLYLTLRKFKGSRAQRFEQTEQLISGQGNLNATAFITELFGRSVNQMQCYSNEQEGFYSERTARIGKNYKFANDLVQKLNQTGSHNLENGVAVKMVDYEIFPLRTTRSIRDNGKPAKSKSAGTLDVLFAVTSNGVTLPGVGEIKAKSENVGITFALIQALMNASLLTTTSQFRRLKSFYSDDYGDHFGNNGNMKLQVDIILMVEKSSKLLARDVKLAMDLRSGLVQNEFVRSITFVNVAEGSTFESFPANEL